MTRYKRDSAKGRGDLWATATGSLLHATEDCCRAGTRRVKVRDHANPSYFDSDYFTLCPEALALVQQTNQHQGEGKS